MYTQSCTVDRKEIYVHAYLLPTGTRRQINVDLTLITRRDVVDLVITHSHGSARVL